MSDEQRDAAVIAAAREVIKGYESEGLPGQYVGTGIGLRMTHQFNLAALRLAALRTIDRLTAERDAARKNESRWRERINAIIAIAESYESLAQNPAVETSVSQERLGFAQDIYQALGIGSEADHD